MKKAQMQQFAWIFSIIVGAVVLFLAFFFVTQYSKQVERPTKQITIASGINILLEPFSAIGSLAEIRAEPIELPAGIYVEFNCNAVKDYSEIKAREKGHRRFDLTEKVYDKYIFAKTIETKARSKFFAFSLPIKIPFYVATATVIVADDYCLASLPNNDYKESLQEVYDSIEDKVDIELDFSCSENLLEGKQYIDGLILAAVFSEDDVYNCNLERILSRAIRIAGIYKEKAMLMQQKGCSVGNVISALDNYINAAKNFKANMNEQNLNSFYSAIEQLKNANGNLKKECRLFEE